MRYRKGIQAEKLVDMLLYKVNLVRDGDCESIWVRLGPSYVVLQNDALCFRPLPSWGVVLPSCNTTGDFLGTIDVSHLQVSDDLELHPDAWEQYLQKGAIDADGVIQDEDSYDEE